MKAIRILLVFSLAFLVGFAGVCFGKTPGGKETPEGKKATDSKKTPDLMTMKEEGPIEIEADRLSFDKEEQLYQAHGNVAITRGDFSLKAEHARLSGATNELVAWGKVVLREGEDVLECERLEVNLNTRTGKVYDGKLFLKEQNFHVVGKEAEKLGESTYRVREGSFTTCDASRPPWKFSVRELDITMGGTGIAK
ncbi:MAG: LPS-assembly protein LptD, partial [Deltaproteobacteria bacterium]